MATEFDPVNKWIKITSGTTISVLDIYNDAMDWVDNQSGMAYDVPMQAVGKFDMGGGVYSDTVFQLINGWKLKFWSETEHFKVTGTFLPETPTTSRHVTPADVEYQVAIQGTIIPDVAEWTQIEKNGIISDVNIIQAKTDLLPPDPASQSTVVSVMAKTDTLPIDPASQSSVDAKVDEKTGDIKGTGFTKDIDSLKQIREYIDELESSLLHSLQVSRPKSIAQYLDQQT